MSQQQKNQEQKIDASKLQQERDEYLAGWQRARADYDNVKKDLDKERASIMEFAHRTLITELLPVVDHFTEAIKYIPADQQSQDWVMGIMHIKKQLDDFLQAEGLERVAQEGDVFDPNIHEAIKTEEQAGMTDKVVEVVRQGYRFKERLIRAARVVVGK